MTQILPFMLEDLGDLIHLTPPDWGDIRQSFQQYLALDMCRSFKLISGTQMIGVGTAICHGNTGWLGHIIVHPDFRAQGYGALITEYLITQLKKERVVTILLNATQLGEPLYTKLGFKPETQYEFYQKELHVTPGEEIDDIIQCTNAHSGKVLELDRLISGEDRRKWIMPHLTDAMLYLHRGQLLGFHLPYLGDGLIYAIDARAGCALMERRMRDHTNAVMPIDNVHAIFLLQRKNFVLYRKARRMYLGKPHIWRPECVYNRISGALG